MQGYILFPTPIGDCGIAWNERGVAAVQLPASSAGHMRTRLRRFVPEAQETDAPPQSIREAIEAIVALLRGEARDLREIELDWQGQPDFNRRVYEFARGIGPGRTLTYGELARAIEMPDAARAVGQALGQNPFPIVVPCHRVLAANGKYGGFSAPGGVETKLRLLAIERARPPQGASATLDLFGD